jgi:hypothetical protein
VAAGLAIAASPAGAQDYPRLGLYGHMIGDGTPFWSATDSTLRADVVSDVSRYHEVVLDASPASEYRPDLLAALRAENPSIRLLAYVLAHNIWNAEVADSMVHYPTRFRRMVRDLDGFLYDRDGGEYYANNVNLAKRDSTGRYVVAEGLANLWYDVIIRTGAWDGLYLDIFCNTICWAQGSGDSIDVVRAGYPDCATLDYHWLAASDTLALRLRQLAGPDFILVGNCGQGTKYKWFNGWMREDFPYQNGETWLANMYREPGGYITDEREFQQPTHNYLFTWAQGPSNPYTFENARRVRFGLGSSSLGGGYSTFGPNNLLAWSYYHQWWFDEYAVDLENGRSSPERHHTGWLGQPVGPYYQMVWPGTGPDACSNPGFETNLAGWTLHRGAFAATMVRDLTAPPAGLANLRVNIPTHAQYDWQISLVSNTTINMIAGQPYSASFWAKATAPAAVTVAYGNANDATVYAQAPIPLSSGWQRYQVTLIPDRNGPGALKLWIGNFSGAVFFDDLHLQEGVSSVYRRDFQRGTVLVNPTPRWANVTLERPYRKILGNVDPRVNNGALVTQVTVDPNDATFLLYEGPPVNAGSPSGIERLAWSHVDPNPFRHNLRLTLAVPSPGPARVSVVDVAGRTVALLHDGPLPSGRAAFAWDGRDRAGRDVRPGVYFLRAHAGDVTATRKILRLP